MREVQQIGQAAYQQPGGPQAGPTGEGQAPGSGGEGGSGGDSGDSGEDVVEGEFRNV
jgi:hypothetical protein